MNKNQLEPKHFVWLNEEIEHDEKVILTWE